MLKKTNFLFILSTFICLLKFTNILSSESSNHEYTFNDNKKVNLINDDEKKFIDRNLKVSPEKLNEIAAEIIKKTFEKKKIFLITPYVEVGIRIPFWAYKGFMDKISPFTNSKCTDLETFDFNEKSSFSKALYLKPLDEINTPFAVNYGVKMTIGNAKKRTKYLRENITDLLDVLKIREKEYIDFDKKYEPKNDIAINNAIDMLNDLVKNNKKNGFPIYNTILNIVDSSRDVINNLIVNKNKNISLTPNSTQVLCPLYLVNIAKFLFIKNATDNYILKHTEKSLEKFKEITKKDSSIEDLTDYLIEKLEYNSLNFFNKKLDFLSRKELANNDNDDNNNNKYYIPEVYDKLCKLKDYEEFKKKSNEKKTIKEFINETIEDIIKNENKLKITKNKEEEDKINEKIKKDQKILQYMREIINNLNYDTAENQTFLGFELNDEFKNLLDNLKESGLLPKRKQKKEYNENNKEINKNKGKLIANYNKKDLEILVGKLKKLKKQKECKKILKNLKLEDIKWWIPYNFRFGILGTHYINTRIGINVDFSFSFSLTGMTKSLFMPEEFLQNSMYYLLKLHEPIVSGRLFNEDKKIKDVIYSNPELSITDLLLDDFLDKLVKLKDENNNKLVQDPLIGSKRGPNPVKKTDAFSNYLKVVNMYNDSKDCLCDIDVSLQQINFCVKIGLCVNLNKLENFNINKNFLLKNFINELSFNCGLYFNWQNLKIEVTENKSYYLDKNFDESIKKNCILQDMLEDAVIDSLKNLEMDTPKDKDKLNNGIEKMVYKIILNSFDSSVAPTNNKIIGFCNNIFENEIPEICCKNVFNSFTVRPVLDFKYKMISPIGLTFMCGCEFIILNPFNIYSNLKNFMNSFENDSIKKNIKNFKIHKDFELLPYMSLGFTFAF